MCSFTGRIHKNTAGEDFDGDLQLSNIDFGVYVGARLAVASYIHS